MTQKSFSDWFLGHFVKKKLARFGSMLARAVKMPRVRVRCLTTSLEVRSRVEAEGQGFSQSLRSFLPRTPLFTRCARENSPLQARFARGFLIFSFLGFI